MVLLRLLGDLGEIQLAAPLLDVQFAGIGLPHQHAALGWRTMLVLPLRLEQLAAFNLSHWRDSAPIDLPQ
jgi:hypothetical protein